MKRVDKAQYATLKELVEGLPQIVHGHTINKTLDEWDLYQTSEIGEQQSNETMEEYWDRVFKMTALGGVQRFGLLGRMVEVMLCLYYRPPPTDLDALKVLDHRRSTRVVREYVRLHCADNVASVPITDGLSAAYKDGFTK